MKVPFGPQFLCFEPEVLADGTENRKTRQTKAKNAKRPTADLSAQECWGQVLGMLEECWGQVLTLNFITVAGRLLVH